MQEMHLFPSIESGLNSFPFVLSFLDASLGEYFLMHASSIILMLCFKKRVLGEGFVQKIFFSQRVLQKLEDTPCKTYNLTSKQPCITTSFFSIQEDLYVCKLNFRFYSFKQELTLLNLKFSYASFLEYACFIL